MYLPHTSQDAVRKKKERKKEINSLNIDLRNTIRNPSQVLSSTLRKCLNEIFDDIVDVLNSDRDTNEVNCDSTGELLCFRELLMSG